MKIHTNILLCIMCFLLCISTDAQLITGYWKGKIDRKNVEVKIIKNGDSLTGTSYYYESATTYRRYSVKGYFDSRDNSVVWWDDILLEEKNAKRFTAAKKHPFYLSTADFNCPGGTKMYLDGKAILKDKEDNTNRAVALEKYDTHTFDDEWDYVIDNYTVGANDPELIDSISKLSLNKPSTPEPVVTVAKKENTLPNTITANAPPKKQLPVMATDNVPSLKKSVTAVKDVVAPLTNEQKFANRQRQVMQEIAISGDSIELRFYDNAEVDGDSIAIFLNNKLLYEHIRLTDRPYSIKLAVAALGPLNELLMVAENLGSIPPNTSLMVAVIEGKHYEARLESTEQSSAVIRFVKK